MFQKEKLTEDEKERLGQLSQLAKGDVLTMTTLAGSGHPGGSMSSLDMYLLLFSQANLHESPVDRVVISHGHTSPGVYASLARLGYLPLDEVIAFFRKAGSPFEGHVVRGIPFIEWSTGNLGQGLSAGCGLAIAAKVREEESHVYVMMGDGEQQKGQISEARRFAKKYGLSNITALIDYNELQISGSIREVMPQNIAENFLSDGWDVIEVNGHDYDEIYAALREARFAANPVCILAHTVMGKGVPFMEHREKYHGSPLSEKDYKEAIAHLGTEEKLDYYRTMRNERWNWEPREARRNNNIETGEAFTYHDADKIDNRTAFGKALKDLGDKNIPRGYPVCVFDCDLASSVKTGDFAKAYQKYFFQGGIQEHNTATVAGSLATTEILTFFADFGVFGIDETYNQQRLNDINKTNLKLILTHVGLDVGPDGKTHQCVDYIGLARNLHRMKIIVPCDPNQTDRAIRYIAAEQGNFLIGMGRNRWPVIAGVEGKPFFGEGYRFRYGKMDVLADGKDGAVITYGGMVTRALRIRKDLETEGVTLMVVNMPCVNEIDEEVMGAVAKLPIVISYEDHNLRTGIAPVITGYLLKHGYRGRFEAFGVTSYGTSGDTDEVLKVEGLDELSVAARLKGFLKGE